MEPYQRKRILIVEDMVPMAAMLQRLMESSGYDAHAEYTGSGGLGYAVHERPNLVILDLQLPDLGGYEVCRRLRLLLHPWVPSILMLTGLDRPIDQLRGFAYGADAYLTKPVDPDELLRTIDQLLGQEVAL